MDNEITCNLHKNAWIWAPPLHLSHIDQGEPLPKVGNIVTKDSRTKGMVSDDLKVSVYVLIHGSQVDHNLFEIDDTIILKIYFAKKLLTKGKENCIYTYIFWKPCNIPPSPFWSLLLFAVILLRVGQWPSPGLVRQKYQYYFRIKGVLK